ncbi:MAG: helix-turn-helix transcriptional regulator [Mucilaginibacter sp.]|nr:helix-turn-helix transcriptional regulator [Mucilaginibacter sp.]
MASLKFIVEKTSTGYSAYREEKNGVIGTTGNNLNHLKDNIVEAYNLYAEEFKKKEIAVENIELQFDLASFFEFYPEINVSALGARIGMHKSLLSEYINGKKTPSEKQIKRVLLGIRTLGDELAHLEIA